MAPRRRVRHARACTRLVRVRTTSLAASAGRNAIALSIRGLAPGGYNAALTVTDSAGNRAPAITRSFTIRRRAKHR